MRTKKIVSTQTTSSGRRVYARGPRRYNGVSIGVAGAGDVRSRASQHENGGILMPYGGNDWLALTQEPTLDPNSRSATPSPFLDRRLQSLPYQRYLLDELNATSLAGTTSGRRCSWRRVRCNRPDGPVALRPVGEVEFVQGWRRQVPADLWTQPRGRRHHRPCRLEARGPGGAGPGALQAASPNRFRASGITSPGVPTRRWTTGRARGSSPNATFRAGRSLVRQGFSWIS